jgi:hypothetical protein
MVGSESTGGPWTTASLARSSAVSRAARAGRTGVLVTSNRRRTPRPARNSAHCSAQPLPNAMRGGWHNVTIFMIATADWSSLSLCSLPVSFDCEDDDEKGQFMSNPFTVSGPIQFVVRRQPSPAPIFFSPATPKGEWPLHNAVECENHWAFEAFFKAK